MKILYIICKDCDLNSDTLTQARLLWRCRVDDDIALQENKDLVASTGPHKQAKAVTNCILTGGQLAATGREENIRR
jgi:hypothetical protein